jgi:hypothetical protein
MNNLNISNNPLSTLRADIRAHWKKYLPRMTKRLAEAGTLEARIEEAARQTEEAVLSYVQAAQGSTFSPAQAFWQAWEIYRNDWAFLPAEQPPQEEEEEEDKDSIISMFSDVYDLYREYYRLRDEARDLPADDNDKSEAADVHDEA